LSEMSTGDMEQALRDVDAQLEELIIDMGIKRRERDRLMAEAVCDPHRLNRRRIELLMPHTGRATIYVATRGNGRYE
jgi:hypothetical protein